VITPGFVFSVLATLTTGLITLWLIYEDWAVWHSDKSGKPKTAIVNETRPDGGNDFTITAWTRYYERLLDVHHQSHWLLIFVLIFGLCVGHLLWH
jgi:hypothetical protein